jgi:hypothetical protein
MSENAPTLLDHNIKSGISRAGGTVSSRLPRKVGAMSAIATLRVFCETDPTLAASVVNGLLAWAAMLGGFTAFFSGLPAAVALFIPSRPESLSMRINRGLGQGMTLGMAVGPLTLFVFIDRVTT